MAHTSRARASRMADLVDSPTSTRPAVVPPNVPVPTGRLYAMHRLLACSLTVHAIARGVAVYHTCLERSMSTLVMLVLSLTQTRYV